MNIANLSRSSVVLRDKSGEPFSIEPGGTANKEVDKDDANVVAHLNAGNIAIGGTEKQAREAAKTGIAPGAVAASQPAS
ncbi:hypothetical protein [Aureimonas psammosilenae]|uniref:hypothetical protein n=1 Tax=Aureimonas psammosilenae TaxID=2495496 RepID=UPI0012610AA2|nr:hypothetical protein [Aureimonas psammosilenae]